MGLACRLLASAVVLAAGPLAAQDSVASFISLDDAMSPYDPELQRVRYVLDLTTATTSWGNRVGVGPVTKGAASLDPMFNTNLLGAAAISGSHVNVAGATLPARTYALWTGDAGAGVHPDRNTPPSSSVNVTAYDRQFGVAFSDVSLSHSNVIGAIVGQNADDLDRLFVERVVGATTAFSSDNPVNATLSLGGVDPLGNVYFRCDDFNTLSTNTLKIMGENIVRVRLAARSDSGATALNAMLGFVGDNQGWDSGATTFLRKNDDVTLNTPALAFRPFTLDPAGALLVSRSYGVSLDFEGDLRMGIDDTFALTSVAAPLVGPASALRGNPSHGLTNATDGATDGGVVATLGVNPAPPGRVNVISVFGLDFAAAFNDSPVVAAGSPASYAMPSPISDGAFSANATGAAEFRQYLSQVSFRGGNGQVGVGQNAAGNLVLAATATDPTAGEFIAVATVNAGVASWTVAAHAGKPVLDGPGGATIGALLDADPVAISAPGVDMLGNVYFTAAWLPAGGESETGYFRAVSTGAGYQLELLLTTGQSLTGVNSGLDYEVIALALADSDSLASGAFDSGHLMQSMVPGHETSDPLSIFSFGGSVVNATIRYTRTGGTLEDYDVLLFVGPFTAPVPGDANGDGAVDFADLNIVLTNYSQSGTGLPGDLNGDGTVDFDDLNLVLTNYAQEP